MQDHDGLNADTTAATLDIITAAIAGGWAAVLLYCDGEGETTARVILPIRLVTAKNGHTVVRCHDCRADEIRSLRVDRITSAYRLNLPPGTVVTTVPNARPRHLREGNEPAPPPMPPRPTRPTRPTRPSARPSGA